MRKIILIISIILINLNMAFSTECVDYERDKVFIKDLMKKKGMQSGINYSMYSGFDKCLADGLSQLMVESKMKCTKDNLKDNLADYMEFVKKNDAENYVNGRIENILMYCMFDGLDGITGLGGF